MDALERILFYRVTATTTPRRMHTFSNNLVYLFQQEDDNTVVVTSSVRNARPWAKAKILFEGTLKEFRDTWGHDDDKKAFVNCIYKTVWSSCDHVAQRPQPDKRVYGVSINGIITLYRIDENGQRSDLSDLEARAYLSRFGMSSVHMTGARH